MGLNQKTAKLIRSLTIKKFRDETGLFFAEGEKLVLDFLNSGLVLHTLLVIDSWKSSKIIDHPITSITEIEMKALSCLDSPSSTLGVFYQPNQDWMGSVVPPGLILALDGIQNPGNMGTILRTADWFGIKDIFCGRGTADAYGPKAVQATMGALARVRLHYTDLETVFMAATNEKRPLVGAFLEGENLYQATLAPDSILILGAEGQGISSRWEKFVTQRLTIPTFPPGSPGPESLNVGIATGIMVAEWRGRFIS